MIYRRPPGLANWLLDRLGHTGRNSALAGDLLEEFHNGRSAAWYWRQTFGVIAKGVAHNGMVRRPYLLALAAAYAAQFALTLVLWFRHAPPAIHGSVSIKVGVWLLAQLIYGIYAGFVNRLVVGEFNPNMKRMYCAVEGGPSRSTVVALAAYQSFSLGLANYSLCALILLRFSLAGLIGAEIAWFVLWIFAPALGPASLPAAEPRKVEDDRPWLAIAQSEAILTVTLPSGGTIVLEQESLAQSVFASGDRELIRVVFGRRRNLELLRRAIWLGGYRSDSHIQGRAESLTLRELAALIDETARTKSVVEAGYEANRRKGFWLRIRRGFYGDPAGQVQ